jgi:phospholipid/glycerol acyltransferase
MIVCTLVLGHSVDFSIFMTCALQKDYSTGKDELPVYKVSVLLASITTFLAIGTLILAKHPALKSIASVSLIGIFSALVITFVFYPSLFKFFIFGRPQKGLSPISLRIFLHSMLSILYYVISSVLFSNIVWLLLKIFPKGKALRIRKWAAQFSTSVLYSNPFVSKRTECSQGIDLIQPSVLIANHTSWLDTLAIGMLTPRVSYMVNDWVYNSVVFGRYVQAMDFYPISQGIEKGMDIFKKNFANGLSVVIFPEGKRSESNLIYRFHKGAFLVAEHFQKPLTLVYIHGNSEVQPKGDFAIYDGSITVVVTEQIAPDDPRFGTTPRERAKLIGKHFREQFAILRRRLEGVNYLKEKLFLNYLYKEPYIVKAVRADFQKRKELYHKLSLALPEDATILHWADDYGQVDFLLLLTYPQRTLITLIEDDEKRAIAQQSYITRIRKIQYYKTLPEGINYDCEVDTRGGNVTIY